MPIRVTREINLGGFLHRSHLSQGFSPILCPLLNHSDSNAVVGGICGLYDVPITNMVFVDSVYSKSFEFPPYMVFFANPSRLPAYITPN